MSEQTQSHSLAESISALVDSQASELELQRILKASEQDPQVKAIWMRYQMAGSLLRGEAIGYGAQAEDGEHKLAPLPDFAARVSAAIAAEDQLSAPLKQTSAKQGLWYQLGRVALVASVAGGMVLGVQQFNTSASLESEMVAASGPSVSAPTVSLPSGINTQTMNTRTVAMQNGYEARPQENRRVIFKPHLATAPATPTSDEEVTRYVNQMIQAHSDNAVMNSNQGVLPYARVIVTEEE